MYPPWSTWMFWFIYCKNGGKGGDKIPLSISEVKTILEIKNDCSHFARTKKCLHADINVKSAYGKESEQCLFSTRWRGMCKKTKTQQGKAINAFTVNTCKWTKELELCTWWLRLKAQPASFSQGHFLSTLMTGTPAPVMLFGVPCPEPAERGCHPGPSHALLWLPCISFKL